MIVPIGLSSRIMRTASSLITILFFHFPSTIYLSIILNQTFPRNLLLQGSIETQVYMKRLFEAIQPHLSSNSLVDSVLAQTT